MEQQNMTPYEIGKDFARHCIEEEFPNMDYPVEEDGVTYDNPQEYASGFAMAVYENQHKMDADAQEFARGFLLKFD